LTVDVGKEAWLNGGVPGAAQQAAGPIGEILDVALLIEEKHRDVWRERRSGLTVGSGLIPPPFDLIEQEGRHRLAHLAQIILLPIAARKMAREVRRPSIVHRHVQVAGVVAPWEDLELYLERDRSRTVDPTRPF
jgi:hypothetical protein